jgi:putative sigma-54 modulation protein
LSQVDTRFPGKLHVQIDISARHGHLSDASRDKIVSKVGKLQRYFDRLFSIEVIVDLKDSEYPRVDIQVSAEHKHDFVAHEQTGSLWGSVDAVVQKLEQQLRRYKEKVQRRNRNHDMRRQEIAADSDEGVDQQESAEFDEAGLDEA